MKVYLGIPISALHVYNALNDAGGAQPEPAAALSVELDRREYIVSMLQAAENALNEIQSRLLQMQKLALLAAGDTMPRQDRERVQLEIEQLKEEIDRIAAEYRYYAQMASFS